jgi:mono/diheme cytochrome c family protein
MPPFPDLTPEEISSVANYIRNAWANGFGSVSTEEVAAVLEGLEETGRMASVWDGVFTESQATRGQAVYPGACGICHGRRLNGAPEDPDMRSTPPLARARFLRVWEGRSLATLFEYTRATMPEDNPNSLTDQEYVDVIAYMLTVGGMPAGGDELQPDPQSLARVVIRPRP